jgi:hypothetical protein
VRPAPPGLSRLVGQDRAVLQPVQHRRAGFATPFGEVQSLMKLHAGRERRQNRLQSRDIVRGTLSYRFN